VARYRALPDWIVLRPGTAEPLYRQIYRRIEAAILEGKLPPDSILPSSRDLAEHLGVSRMTVVNAYEWLIAEGLAATRPGSGIRVAVDQPAPEAHRSRAGPAERSPPGTPHPGHPLRMHPRGPALAFQPDTPALDQFPRQVWARTLKRCGCSPERDMLDYGHRGGYAPLRQMIARYLISSRGVGCDPSQVIIVGSIPAAIHLAAAILALPADVVALEDPGYSWARKAVERLLLNCEHVAVDDHGIRVDELVQRLPHARIACITPCHQWPTGVSLSAERRSDLLAWTRTAGAWVLEDDYDSEFHFELPVPRPLKADAGSERVILIGGFARTLVPSIRCAYLVVPAGLEDAFVEQVIILGAEPSLHIQAAVAEFMKEGHFTRHIQRVRKVYRTRRDALQRALTEMLGGIVTLRPAAGGLQVVADLPAHLAAEAVAREAAKRALTVRALSIHYARQPAANALHLGFGAVPDAEIEPAVRRLAEAIDAAQRTGLQ
jgi:GntR family transcriptional regulator/MocR family aminotransferase